MSRCGIESAAGDAAEITGSGGRRQRGDDSEVELSDILRCGRELPPLLERVSDTAEAKSPSEIISAAAGDDQNRPAQFDQQSQVPVYGAIAAEDQDGFGVVG